MAIIANKQWLNKLNTNDKVLLINPPVQEIRYAWSKWNQPTDLLLLSNKLKNEIHCEVELLDFMLPGESGRVPFKLLNRERKIGDNEFSMSYRTKYYGVPINEVSSNLSKVVTEWKPTHIVLTSLTSYWYDSLLILLPILRTLLPEVQITLMGSYAVIETEHATRLNFDYIINDSFSFEDEIPDFNIYFQPITRMLNQGNTIKFGGLIYTKNSIPENLIKQIVILQENNIRDYVIYDQNIFKDDCTLLVGLFDEMDKENIKGNFYGLCGIELDSTKEGIFLEMLNNGFKSFFIEHNKAGNELNLDNYLRMYNELVVNSPKKISSGNLAGFVMVGTPEDKLENMFKQSLNILEICGSIIPKPYTPSPGSEEYNEISKRDLLFLSPHMFPMAERSGITRKEYVDFYKHTTFLNEKRAGNAFNFFDQKYTSIALRNSLKKKVGKE